MAVAAVAWFLLRPNREPPLGAGHRIFFAATIAPDHPDIFRRFFTESDLARVDTLPTGTQLPRSQTYALVTTLRREWAGFAGLKHFLDQDCGPQSPGTVIYDPELRELTPRSEQTNMLRSIRTATRRVKASSCHEFGLSPGATPFFGLDPKACTFDLEEGLVEEIDWTDVDLVDVQAQRLLGEECLDKGGLETYTSAISTVARVARDENPDIDVLAQVSFRDNEPESMLEGLRAVADVIDGIYFSYPTNNPDFPCLFCTSEHLESFLEEVR